MKTYMALDGLRWSRDSASVHCNMPRSAVFGRSGGGGRTSRTSQTCRKNWGQRIIPVGSDSSDVSDELEVRENIRKRGLRSEVQPPLFR